MATGPVHVHFRFDERGSQQRPHSLHLTRPGFDLPPEVGSAVKDAAVGISLARRVSLWLRQRNARRDRAEKFGE